MNYESFEEAFQKLSESQKEQCKIVDSIFNINEENVEFLIDSIKLENKCLSNEYKAAALKEILAISEKYQFQNLYNYSKLHFEADLQTVNLFYLKCVNYASTIRPKQISSCKRLFDVLIKKYDIDESIFSHGGNAHVPETPNEIQQIILDDSVEDFVKFVAQPNFNPKDHIEIVRFGKKTYLTYIQYMAQCGSVKCFKYALLDGSFSLSDISNYAVEGGNAEIIKLLVNKEVSFDDNFMTAIKFHRLEIAEYILKNFSIGDYHVKSFNFAYDPRVVRFFLDNGFATEEEALENLARADNLDMFKDIYSKHEGLDVGKIWEIVASESANDIFLFMYNNVMSEVSFNSLFKIAFDNNNIQLAEYFLDYHNIKFDEDDDYIVRIGSCNNLQFIIDFYNKAKGKSAKNSLFYIKTDFLKQIINEGLIDISEYECVEYEDFSYRYKRWNTVHTQKINRQTFIHNFVEEGDLEMVKLLVEKGKVDVNAWKYLIIDDYISTESDIDEDEDLYQYTPLYIAMVNNNLELCKYLVEHGADPKKVSKEFFRDIRSNIESSNDLSALEVVEKVDEEINEDIIEYFKSLQDEPTK